MSTTCQNEIIDFLSNPLNFGLPATTKITRFDTHISIVFLVGNFAYKLKKARKLTFLDFSRLDDRAHFCRQEVEINRRFSPDLYVGLVALTRTSDNHIEFDGSGDIVDYVIKMHRFKQSDLFDQRAANGQLSRQLMEQFTDTVYQTYQNAPITADLGGLHGMKTTYDGHFNALSACPAPVFNPADIDTLRQRIQQELRQLGPFLNDRQKNNFVRHCHGDLHLRNIALFNDHPTPFDAIEFEDNFAKIDVMYDLAFLLMDFLHRGMANHASWVLNRYLGISGDIDSLRALPLFISSRATIRAYVEALAIHEQTEEAKKAEKTENARTYMAESLTYLERSSPYLIAIGGLSASGKSTQARLLAPLLPQVGGAFIARSDMVRKRLLHCPPEQKLPASAYSQDMNHQTYDTLHHEVETALDAGYSVITDGVFARKHERDFLKTLAKRHGVTFAAVWLDTPTSERVTRAQNRRNDISDADERVVKKQAGYKLGTIDWDRINAHQPIDDVQEDIRKSLLKQGVLLPTTSN